jgi:tetratricopeptide (TPR) repeat protein
MVAARNSAYAASQKTLDVKALGLALNVATVLSATVRRDGTHVRISAQLSDTKSGFGIWSASYDRELTDIFAVQHEIAQQAVHALLGALPGADKPLQQRLAVTGNVYAYDAYLHGMQLLHRSNSDKNLDAAIAQFSAALGADKRFARAQAGICTAEISRHEIRHDAKAIARARDACERAQAMDGELREVNLALGDLFRAEGDAAKASENYTKALDKPALRAEAYIGLARVEVAAKHDELAAQYFERSRDIDSGNWSFYLALGNFRAARGKSAAAIEAYRTAISLAPDDAVSPWNNLGALYFGLLDYEHAAEAFNRSVAIEPTQSGLSNLGSVRFALGDYPGAAVMYRRAAELAPDDHRTWGNLADALGAQADQGEPARAVYGTAVRKAEVWLAMHPEDAEATAELAWFYVNVGDATRARSEIAKAEALETRKTDVAIYAAQVYASLGDDAAARERLSRARSGGISDKELSTLPVLKRLLAKAGRSG